jgi:hypothetical protein
MVSALTSLPGSATVLPLSILCGALTIIIVAVVAARLIRGIAHQALDKADPRDIPDVILALSRLLDRFHGFLPLRDASPPQRGRSEDEPNVSPRHPPTNGGQ